MLVREGEENNDHFYIVAKGLVRLECMNNPYRKREYKKDGLLGQMTKQSNSPIKGPKIGGVHRIYDKGSGVGNLSETFNKTNLGIVQNGQWVGDECCILKGEIPQIYTAICESVVLALKIRNDDFHHHFPFDIKKEMDKRAYNKLFTLR